jgi:hypothetical protein
VKVRRACRALYFGLLAGIIAFFVSCLLGKQVEDAAYERVASCINRGEVEAVLPFWRIEASKCDLVCQSSMNLETRLAHPGLYRVHYSMLGIAGVEVIFDGDNRVVLANK